MNWRTVIFLFLAMDFAARVKAQTTYSVTNIADTFLATASPGNPLGTNLTGLNFGAAGALFIAPASSAKGEFQSLLRFDLSAASNSFNAAYGTNNWSIGGISLTLTGNNGGASEQPNNMIFPMIVAGSFVIEWLSDNSWTEGTGTPITPTTDGVTYNSLPDLLSGATAILSTNTYTPPGDNVPLTYALPLDTNVVAEILNGGEVSFRLYAADNQVGYLFNSYNFGRGNQPLINVTAEPMPPRFLRAYFTNDGFELSGAGIPSSIYVIQAVTNLSQTNWQTLGTVSANSTGFIEFDDTNAPTPNRRFYRLAE